MIYILDETKPETEKLFHGNYIQDDHEDKDNWQFTSIDQCTTNAELRKREVYWQHRLKMFFPNGLNEREEFLFIISWLD